MYCQLVHLCWRSVARTHTHTHTHFLYTLSASVFTPVPTHVCSTLQDKITLVKKSFKIPEYYQFGESVVVPMWAGQEVEWQVQP